MYDVEKCSSVLQNAVGNARLCEIKRVHIQSRNKMAALGYVYTLRKQTFHSPKCCTSRNATSAEFLEVQIFPMRPRVWLGSVGVLCAKIWWEE